MVKEAVVDRAEGWRLNTRRKRFLMLAAGVLVLLLVLVPLLLLKSNGGAGAGPRKPDINKPLILPHGGRCLPDAAKRECRESVAK